MRRKSAILFALLSLLIAGQAFGQKKTTLVIAGRDGDYGNAMQLAVDAYLATHPDVRIELFKMSGDDIYQKTVIDLKSGAGSYDLILIDDPKALQYQKAKWLENLDALYKKAGKSVDADFISNVLDLCRYPNASSGTLYALPFVGNVSLFAYRKDLFAKYGLAAPATWTDVLSGAKKIAEKEPGVSGVSFRGVKGNPVLTAFLPVFWSFGADFMDAKGKPTVNSPEGIKALEYFIELSKLAPKSLPMNNTAQVRDALLGGSVGIAPEVWPAWLGKMDDPSQSLVAGKVAVGKHPAQVKKSSPMIGIWHIAIPAASKNKAVAFDFLQFVTSAQMQKKMALEAGLPPSRASIFSDPDILKAHSWYPAIKDALENGVARPRTMYWSEIENIMGASVQEALIGEKTAAQALTEANEKLAKVLK